MKEPASNINENQAAFSKRFQDQQNTYNNTKQTMVEQTIQRQIGNIFERKYIKQILRAAKIMHVFPTFLLIKRHVK